MKILFTGFAPGPHDDRSCSWKWIEDASALAPETAFVESLALPPTWDGCFEPLRGVLNQGWDAVVCVASREHSHVAIERIALNENDVACKDSEGRRPRSKIIDTDGEPGYWTGLPYRELGALLTEAKIPAKPSHSAGGGVSNFLFYQLMRWIALSRRELLGGLIHVPEREAALPVTEETRRSFVNGLLSAVGRSAESGDSLMVNLDRLRLHRESPMSR